MESTSTPVEEMPISQPEFTPSVAPVTEETQSSDLQAILQGEASASPMGPVTDHVMEETTVLETPATAFTPTPVPETIETPITPVMDTQFYAPVEASAFPSFTTSAPEVAPVMPDLQQFVNNQVSEVPPMATPMMETPVSVAAPVETPVTDFNQAPATDTTTPTQTGTTFSI